jgi:Na+/H+-dicarboxylate symporter
MDEENKEINKVEPKSTTKKIAKKGVNILMIAVITILLGVILFLLYKIELLKQENETLREIGTEMIKQEAQAKFFNK